jgi:peptidoglycan/LPS O-acetylase OafA/YrhL
MRAVAVVGVFLYHSHESFFAAGWLGVDAFFVLSGYLITNLLLEERARKGAISLVAFWARRAARLYPALIVAVGLAIGLSATTGVDWLGSAVALAYLSNLWMATGHDMGLLGHTWSLAIEEQFYLLWPVLVVCCSTARRVALVAATGAALSMGCLLALGRPPGSIEGGVFVFPLTRAWELLIGCVLAAVLSGRTPGRSTAAWAATLCVVTSVAGTVIATLSAPPLPRLTIAAALAVAATVAFLVAVAGEHGLAGLMSRRPLPWLGRISYGVYLFHLPLLKGIQVGSVWGSTAMAAVLTVLLAWVSFQLVERPCQRWMSRRLGADVRAGSRRRQDDHLGITGGNRQCTGR